MSTEVWCDSDGYRCKYGPIGTLSSDIDDNALFNQRSDPVGPQLLLIHPDDYPEWYSGWNRYPKINLQVDGNRLRLKAANGFWVWLLEPAHRREPWLSARFPESLGRLVIGRWPD